MLPSLAGYVAPTVSAYAQGEPMSVRAEPARPAQPIQASIPAWACSGVALAIWSCAETGAR